MKKTVLILLSLCCSSVLNAGGDLRAGEQKSTVCAACHGAKGVSPNPIWPNLAGQHQAYFVKQIKDFKDGHHRNSPEMTAMVSNLSRQDIDDLAMFYASFPVPSGVTPKRYLQRGELLYRGGDSDKHITACIACHGPNGTGNAQAGFPVLSGQHAEYTVLQLQQFKEGKRCNDLNSIMQDISKRMDPDDMQAVAHYIAGLY